jgi:hypothetical protein
MKIGNNKFNKPTIIISTLVFIAFAVFYYVLILVRRVPTDIQLHSYITYCLFSGLGTNRPNILYFLVVYIGAGFSTSMHALYCSSVIVVAISIALKYLVTTRIYGEFSNSIKLSRNEILLSVFTFLFLLIASNIPYRNPFMPENDFLFGSFSPNEWHNSTTIFLMPFALLLFWYSYLTITQRDKDYMVHNLILVILNIAIKPSFFMVYTVVYPLFLLGYERFNKRFFRNIIPVVVGLVFLYLEYVFIYKIMNHSILSSKDKGEATTVAFAPFALWRNEISLRYAPLALFSSYTFPLLYFIFYFKEIRDKLNLYVIAYCVVAFLLFVCIVETGDRMMDGNFAWQVIVCSYLLFMVVAFQLLQKIKIIRGKSKNERIKIILLSSVFLIHVFSGLIWLGRIYFFKSYL